MTTFSLSAACGNLKVFDKVSFSVQGIYGCCSSFFGCRSHFGGHLGFLKMLKGERFTPTLECSSRPYPTIIHLEKNFIEDFEVRVKILIWQTDYYAIFEQQSIFRVRSQTFWHVRITADFKIIGLLDICR